MVKIKKQVVSNAIKNKVSYGGTNSRKGITVHQTGNTSAGANAQAHANLQSNGNARNSGWHWQIDDVQAIQSFDHTAQVYHAGSRIGNETTIGVEICVNSDGDYNKAVANGAKLVAKIMKDENISIDNVYQHNYWSGKNCPTQIRAGKNGIGWKQFKEMVQGEDVKPSTPSKPKPPAGTTISGAKLVKNENAFFLATSNIKVRNKPTTSAKNTGTFPKGSSLNYKRVFEGNGYRWLEYTGNSGNTLYLPYRRTSGDTKSWGTFHSKRPTSTSNKKSNSTIAKEVLDGKWGNNPQRKKDLEKAGYNYSAIQKEVNKLTGGGSKPTIKVGDTVTATHLYETEASTTNVRSSSIRGYVDRINNKARNPIRLQNKKGGYYIGFTRKQDIK